MPNLIEALRAEMQPHARVHVSYGDLTGLTGVDPHAYLLLARYFDSVREESARLIRAQAIVFGSGLAAAVAAGFFTVYKPPFPYKAFSISAVAIAWLGIEPAKLSAWEALRAQLAVVSNELAALRAWLEQRLANADVDSAARALGLSVRTLQRRLRDAKTSFQKELDVARLDRARTRLEAEDEKLATIGRELGFVTHQHFTDWFRKVTGESPSDYRARHGRRDRGA
jgi:AraC-like DNA-binding protein